ncbi:conserved hypothetical protein [Anaeromyxobacter sp. K]|uniref:prepilin-type N-terminal cleavage/methylation domain-containing protein n=1 Tax=Anaeromyxobacter sp. (strain K) TaxID=447217 RepID=UPI00015F8E46|nr:prepilin-type N-terminal cleavage/methylation domain-containing protein [Anaeromyxobacter sp. K]ACG71966.1 conserved hypothetical protein [Anaeromyxobacter sp. K]
MKKVRHASAGFTLIELMTVVAIIGILASVAIPLSVRASLRAKASERNELMLRVKAAAMEVFIQNGNFPAGHILADFQPPLPSATGKRPIDFRAVGWDVIFPAGQEILGNVYYSFRAEAWGQRGAEPPTIEVRAVGDLDGDGTPSTALMTFKLIDGGFRLIEAESSYAESYETF